MTRIGLALCLALIAFGAINALGSLAAVVAMESMRPSRAAEQRAGRLLLIRLLPTALSLLVVAALLLPAFLIFEPRVTDERVTPLMLLLAAVAATIFVFGPLRAVRAGLATRRLVREWRRGAGHLVRPDLAIPARVIDVPFPLVTVVGVFRPQLFIARRVLEGCSKAEMAAVVRHELGHVERRDNWKRLLLSSLPDWLAVTPWAARLEERWSEASEEAADDHAARGGSPVDLASALVKVARLTRQADPPLAPASTLYRGRGLERRVGRLLHTPVDRRPGRGAATVPWIALLLAGMILALGIRQGLLHHVHGLNETVVRLLQ